MTARRAPGGLSRTRPTLAEVRNLPPAIDVRTAANVLGVSATTAYEAIRAGTFPARVVTVGGTKRVITATLVALLEGDGGALAS